MIKVAHGSELKFKPGKNSPKISFAAISKEPSMTKDTKVVKFFHRKTQVIEDVSGEIYVKYPLENYFNLTLKAIYDSSAPQEKAHIERKKLFALQKK